MNTSACFIGFTRIWSAVLFLLLGSISSTSAQVLFSNLITGSNPNADSPYTLGQIVDPSLSVGGIDRGSGITSSNANDRYSATSWNTPALDASAYFTWTLAPNSGYTVDFVNFSYVGQASGTGPTLFSFRTSLDGFTSAWGLPLATGGTINLTDDFFQDISGPIEFRLYGWNASSAAGTFSVNEFAFSGTTHVTSAIPEASTFAAAAGLAALSFAAARRRR